MHLNLSLAPLVALIAGILILVMPKLLNYIVALYLIFIGLIGLLARRRTAYCELTGADRASLQLVKRDFGERWSGRDPDRWK